MSRTVVDFSLAMITRQKYISQSKNEYCDISQPFIGVRRWFANPVCLKYIMTKFMTQNRTG